MGRITSGPLGTCSSCGRPFLLRIDGTVRHHRARIDGSSRTCPGAYKPPAAPTKSGSTSE